jgi:hypothetical protein
MKLGTQFRTRKAARRSISIFISVLSIIALVALMATPALAHHKDGHENGPGSSNDRTETSATSDHDGDADSDSSTSYTEDNDTNDGGTANNVADEGDNKHPSGKDRSVENGGSGTQGKSESNPDDSKGPMRYEGALGDDKANGPGGTDLADQDGNNGCGNDDDFDDDNNGHCGRKKDTTAPVSVSVPDEKPIVQPATVEKVCPANTDFAGQAMDSLKDCNKDIVLGSVITRPAIPKVQAAPLAQAAPAGVLGAVLPFTGGDVTIFLALGLGLIALGALGLKVRSTEA